MTVCRPIRKVATRPVRVRMHRHHPPLTDPPFADPGFHSVPGRAAVPAAQAPVVSRPSLQPVFSTEEKGISFFSLSVGLLVRVLSVSVVLVKLSLVASKSVDMNSSLNVHDVMCARDEKAESGKERTINPRRMHGTFQMRSQKRGAKLC